MPLSSFNKKKVIHKQVPVYSDSRRDEGEHVSERKKRGQDGI